MHSRALTLLLSGAIGLLATGCASTTPTFRGQSPNPSFASFGGPVQQGYDNSNGAGCPNGQCYPGPSGYASQCPPGGHCHNGHCNGAGHCNIPFHPVHRNFHTYSAPQGLMYPPENAAPAMVQYPYYTLRGPTDFFMK